MQSYRSRSRQAMSALLTDEPDSSSLPALTTNPAAWNRRHGVTYPGLLPTLTATQYGSNRGGANPNGPIRPALPTLLASHPEALRDRRGMKHPLMLPTMTARDEKGPGPAHTKGGRDLSQSLGGHLSPTWCLWFMGFPADWLDVDDAHVFARSGTRSSRSAPK